MNEEDVLPPDPNNDDDDYELLDKYPRIINELRTRYLQLEISGQDYLESLRRYRRAWALGISEPSTHYSMFFFIMDILIADQEEALRKESAIKINVRGGLKELASMLLSLEEAGTIDHVEDKDTAQLFTVRGAPVNAGSLKTIRSRDIPR